MRKEWKNLKPVCVQLRLNDNCTLQELELPLHRTLLHAFLQNEKQKTRKEEAAFINCVNQIAIN